MLMYKILFKITGSIAAYKSAYLISKLIQNNLEVQTVATESAFEFIGKATLEGLTGKPVMTNSFSPGQMMSHINLVKWADLTIMCPASANTINKLANGIGDNLVTSLFLAHDWSKPYIIAPAMNTAMFDHPATKESLNKLDSWGVKILPTDDGYLACGDYGKGKLLDPDKIFDYIQSILKAQTSDKKLNVLITSGGTKEDIDGIRYLTNLSTGKTASVLAQHFINKGHNVTYLSTPDAAKPFGSYDQHVFTNFQSLNESIKQLLGSIKYDCIIHNAAVSDYSAYAIESNGRVYDLPMTAKLSSASDDIKIHLMRNPKIVDSIKSYSKNKKVFLVSFKFTNENDDNKKKEQVNSLMKSSGSNVVVLNDFSDRLKNNIQQNFILFTIDGTKLKVENSLQLSVEIEKIITSKLLGDRIKNGSLH